MNCIRKGEDANRAHIRNHCNACDTLITNRDVIYHDDPGPRGEKGESIEMNGYCGDCGAKGQQIPFEIDKSEIVKALREIEGMAAKIQCWAYFKAPCEQGCPKGHMGTAGIAGAIPTTDEVIRVSLSHIKSLLIETKKDMEKIDQARCSRFHIRSD